jgi:hypothetical protein
MEDKDSINATCYVCFPYIAHKKIICYIGKDNNQTFIKQYIHKLDKLDSVILTMRIFDASIQYITVNTKSNMEQITKSVLNDYNTRYKFNNFNKINRFDKVEFIDANEL